MKYYIILNFKNNKLKSFSFFLLNFLVLLVIVLLTNFKFSFYRYLNYISENYYDARKIEALNMNLSYEEMQEEIKNIEHVVDVFFEDDYKGNFDVDPISNISLEKLYIAPADVGYMPQAIKGDNIKTEGDLICPIQLAVANTSGFNTVYIDMEQYLGKSIVLNKDIYYLESMNAEPTIIETKSYTFKIVGLYDYSVFGDEPYYCYAYKDEIGKIVEETKAVYADGYYSDEYQYEIGSDTGIFPWIQIIVDKNENVLYVERELEKLEFECSTLYFIDYDFFDSVSILFNIVLIVVIVIFGLIFYSLLGKSVRNRENELWILKAVGYNDNQIVNIVLLNMFVIFCFSFVVSIILSKVIIFLINNYISKNAQLIGLVVQHNYLILLVIFICFLTLFLLFKFNLKYKIKKILRRKIYEN